jgi:hypothetical protein
MYQRKLQPTSFGFPHLDAFLQSLESFCDEFCFRRIGSRIIITLVHPPTDLGDSISTFHKREVLKVSDRNILGENSTVKGGWNKLAT